MLKSRGVRVQEQKHFRGYTDLMTFSWYRSLASTRSEQEKIPCKSPLPASPDAETRNQ